MDPCVRNAFQASWILEARGRRETTRSFARSMAGGSSSGSSRSVGSEWRGFFFVFSRLAFSSLFFFFFFACPKEGRDLGGSESGFLLEVKGWGAPILCLLLLLLLLPSAAFPEDAVEAKAHDGGAGGRWGGGGGEEEISAGL